MEEKQKHTSVLLNETVTGLSLKKGTTVVDATVGTGGHAEKIAERIFYFNELPTTKPAPIDVGKDIKEMLRLDVGAEEEAITLYKDIIKLAGSEGDSTTRLLFEEILSDEEDHHDTFTTLLEE